MALVLVHVQSSAQFVRNTFLVTAYINPQFRLSKLSHWMHVFFNISFVDFRQITTSRCHQPLVQSFSLRLEFTFLSSLAMGLLVETIFSDESLLQARKSPSYLRRPKFRLTPQLNGIVWQNVPWNPFCSATYQNLIKICTHKQVYSRMSNLKRDFV